MRIFSLVTLSVFVVFGLVFGIFLKPPAYFDYTTGAIYCTNRADCLHEAGHKADQSKGWISQSKDFRDNVNAYRFLIYEHPELRDAHSWDILSYPGIGSPRGTETNPFSTTFWEGGWGGYSELYADIVRWADGDPHKCPANLSNFIDWDFVGNEMEGLGYGR